MAALLGRGEREAVLADLDACERFWPAGRGRLQQWRTAVRTGQKPALGAERLL